MPKYIVTERHVMLKTYEYQGESGLSITGEEIEMIWDFGCSDLGLTHIEQDYYIESSLSSIEDAE